MFFNHFTSKEQTKMNGATAGLLPPATRHIPTRRIEVHDPSHMPSAYSTTPGGTIFSTTPGGKYLEILLCYNSSFTDICFGRSLNTQLLMYKLSFVVAKQTIRCKI